MPDTKSSKNLNQLGRNAYKNGDLNEAREIYQQALSENASDADSLLGLAAVEVAAQNFKLAEEYIRRAIEINRYGVGYQSKLGDVLVSQKRYREAETAYFEELRMRPEYAVSHAKLGKLMLRNGNIKRAIKHLESALQFDTDNYEAAISLGKAYLEDEDLEGAHDAFNRATQTNSEASAALAYMGIVNLRLEKNDQALVYFDKALENDPKCAPAIKGRGFYYSASGEVQKAIASFNQVLEIDSQDAEATISLAKLWNRQGVWDAAEKYFRCAHELQPNNIAVLNQWADLQVSRGSIEAAGLNYEKALQIKPSDQISLAGYGRIKAITGDTKLALSKLSSAVQSGQASTQLLGTYARLLGAANRGREGITLLEQRLRTRVVDHEKCSLHFTLGDLLHADSSYDLAFHNYRKANQLKKAKFDEKKFNQYCNTVIQEFSKVRLNRATQSTVEGENLVFLLGMPRSGVQVLEKYLQSLDGISACGNSPFVEMTAYRISAELNHPWPSKIDQYDVAVLSHYAQLFSERLAMGASEGDRLVDATWRNFLYIGMIQLLFPKARIVYCSRDYRDIALSCFFTNFYSPAGMSFAYNLDDIAKFINGHKRVMAHWSKVTKLPLHTVSYERMILDFEDETAALLKFLGMSITNEQAANAKTNKLPKPSTLRSTSLRRYRHYKYHLESFLQQLESPPDIAF